MTPRPKDAPPPNVLKFQKRPETKGAEDSQLQKNIRLAVGILLLVATALIWHFATMMARLVEGFFSVMANTSLAFHVAYVPCEITEESYVGDIGIED